MKIGLLNLEPKYRNYALDKIRVYYSTAGHDVEDYIHLAYHAYDKIFCSSIFSWTPKPIIPKAICGGTGFNLTDCLPREIEGIKPHLNYGFTTRGCINNCPFCVVPVKEGKVKIVGDLLDLWDGKTKDITIYDNNILAIPEQFELICKQAIDNNIRLDFNQGLDHRLLTPEICKILKRIRHKEYHFAFDNPGYKRSVSHAIDLLQAAGINRSIWYVLVGFNTSLSEDISRLNYLKERNQNAFVQRYNLKSNKQLIALSHWANHHSWFHGITFEQFLNYPKNIGYKRVFQAEAVYAVES